MEFNEKLQELRKRKGLTQEELAQSLYVSRTAVSKWESGRGYPSIDYLKEIARFFGVTVDALLSGEELLSIAEEDGRQKEDRICGLTFGLLDISVALLFFLPFFGQSVGGVVQEVSLISLTEPRPWLLALYHAVIIMTVLHGILTLALQGCTHAFWIKNKKIISFVQNSFCVLVFIISRQPYAAAFTFVFLIIKALMLAKKR